MRLRVLVAVGFSALLAGLALWVHHERATMAALLDDDPAASGYLLIGTDHGLVALLVNDDDVPACGQEHAWEVSPDDVPPRDLSADERAQLRRDVEARGGVVRETVDIVVDCRG